MKPFTAISKLVRRRFPNARFEPDVAAKSRGASYLNVEHDGHVVVVEKRPGYGYGVSCDPRSAYGEGPHEVFRSPQLAAKRVISLLLSRTKTSSPQPVRLQTLRKLRGVSQVKLAKRLGINQAAVSKLETHDDLRLSKLQSVVAAMKGRLNIRVAFPDGTSREIQLAEKKKQR